MLFRSIIKDQGGTLSRYTGKMIYSRHYRLRYHRYHSFFDEVVGFKGTCSSKTTSSKHLDHDKAYAQTNWYPTQKATNRDSTNSSYLHVTFFHTDIHRSVTRLCDFPWFSGNCSFNKVISVHFKCISTAFPMNHCVSVTYIYIFIS